MFTRGKLDKNRICSSSEDVELEVLTRAVSDMKIDVMVMSWMRGEDYKEQRCFSGGHDAI